jgi:uncharacterized protein
VRRLPAIPLLVLLVAPAFALQVDALLDRLSPSGYVNDFAGVMSPEVGTVEALLTELNQKTGAEVAVVTVDSLEGGDINDFATRLFERWGIGSADQDDGVLIVAAIGDRRVWIEVGYGLEGLIPDGRAGRILDESVIPYVAQDDYASGLTAGAVSVAGIIAQNAGVELTGVPAVQTLPPTQQRNPLGGIVTLIFILLLIPILWRHPWLLLLLMSGGRGGGFGGGGGGFGRGSGGGFGGFGGGMSGGGGAGRSW